MITLNPARLCPRLDWNQLPSLNIAAALGIACIWCVALICFRVVWSWSTGYVFLFWNLMLAGIPLVFSTIAGLGSERLWRIGFGCLWLLFFPNAPYIMTDLMHLRMIGSGPVWFDILLLTSCAGTGLAMGYASMAQIQGLFERAGARALGWITVVGSFFLAGFGIYVGRFLRWSSWHVFTNPRLLFSDVTERVLNPLAHPRTWGVTVGFGMFLLVGYLLLRLARRSTADPKKES